MKANLLELIDFDKVDSLLEGFNKSTGFVTAILDLEGKVLSRSGWRQLCTDFHRVHNENSKKCTFSDTVLAGKHDDDEKYHFYECLNGLVDVAVPIVINGEHIANLFSGQFFFKEPDPLFFKKQAETNGFNEAQYMEALGKVPVVTKEKVQVAMDFLLNMTQFISETLYQKQEQAELNKALRESEEEYRNLIEFSPVAMCIIHDWQTIYFNPAAIRLFGAKTQDELIGKHVFEFVHPDFHELAKENSTLLAEKGFIDMQELKYLKLDGRVLDVETQAKSIRFNDDVATLVVMNDITERKHAEIALAESEENLSITLNSIGEGVISTDINGLVVQMNPVAETLCGWKLTEALGKPITEVFKIINTETRQTVPDPVEKVLENCKIIGLANHTVLLSKDGTEYHISDSAAPIKNRTSAITGVVLVFSDVTEKILAQKNLKESEEKYRKAFHSSSDSVNINKMDGTYVDINEGFTTLTGYTRKDVIGNSSLELDIWAIPEHRNTLLAGLRKNNSVSNFETNFRCKDGSIKTALMSAEIIYLNDEQHILSITRDITERKQAELLIKRKSEEIELNNQRLESLLKVSHFQTNSIQELLDFALSEAITLTKSKIGYIYLYNETNKQFILNTFSKGVMQECNVMNPQSIYDLDKTGFWGEAVRQRKPIIINDYQAENSLKKGTPQGHVKLQKFLTIPVIFEQKIVAVAGVANKENDYDPTDIRQLTLLMDSVWKISERLSLIKDLTIAKEHAEESDRLKSAFLANMSHEIRTPMNGILGFSELLKMPDLTGEQQQDYISIIEKSGERMLNIINDIVDISKIEAGLMKLNITETNLYEQLEYIHTFFKPEVEAKGMTLFLRNTIPVKDAILLTDREKVYAILTNLVKNAIKYTKEGYIEIGIEKKVDSFNFYVKDSGIGIPKDSQEAIFERFIQADVADKMVQQGAGLGLSITKAYVEMLGGKIWVESLEGKGSTFYFTLPYQAKPTKGIMAQPFDVIDEANRVGKLKILIAEDDDISQLLMEIIVKPISKEIIKVSNGIQAVNACQKNPDIDLVMMDVHMPEMDGYEATRQIRKFNNSVVVIAQTAYGLSGDLEKAMDAGCNDYLSKPINKEQMFTLLHKHFG